MLKLKKIISGDQTGADLGALKAAKALGLSTCGWMPRDFMTELGPRPDIAKEFNLIPHAEIGYMGRTVSNILYADATFIFGNLDSPGSTLTYYNATKYKKPVYCFNFAKIPNLLNIMHKIYYFIDFIDLYNIEVLNIAGNRESKNKGIEQFVETFITRAITIARIK